jgi:glutathione S-transferase
MILIGQFDSPFVRRTAIALRWYELAFEHRPWSVWRDAEQVARYNPLRRVPVLVLEDGLALVESSAILDELDQRAEPSRLLLPRSGAMRRQGLRVIGFATGVADKAVSLFYERLLREAPSQVWLDRCRTQIFETLDMLNAERSAQSSAYWLGEHLSHADIALACTWRFMSEALADVMVAERWSSLRRDAARLEEHVLFREICQPFTVTMKSEE